MKTEKMIQLIKRGLSVQLLNIGIHEDFQRRLCATENIVDGLKQVLTQRKEENENLKLKQQELADEILHLQNEKQLLMAQQLEYERISNSNSSCGSTLRAAGLA